MMRRRTNEKDQGVALVETALVLPLLVLLLFGLLDVGRLVYAKIELHQAVQEGSLWGSYYPDAYSGVQTRVAESLNHPDTFPSDVVVTCPAGGDSIRVSLSRDMDLLSPLGPGTVTLNATAEGELFTDDTCAPSP
ncbi:MAG: TadE/TadG family type IV pilus assembly protein [Acidimicrobiia bacterium]|nr:TadE/TadG family type IV pilus assembly protein [Acidimicrobiia bacterium]